MHKRGICRHPVSVCPSRSWIASKRIPTGSWEPPKRGRRMQRGLWENVRPISRSNWETVIVRWAHSERQFVSIEFSFHPYNFRSRLKTWLFELTLAWHWPHSPAALHFVSFFVFYFNNSVKCPCDVTHDSVTLIFTFLIIIIIITFSVIAPGASPGETKMW